MIDVRLEGVSSPVDGDGGCSPNVLKHYIRGLLLSITYLWINFIVAKRFQCTYGHLKLKEVSRVVTDCTIEQKVAGSTPAGVTANMQLQPYNFHNIWIWPQFFKSYGH